MFSHVRGDAAASGSLYWRGDDEAHLNIDAQQQEKTTAPGKGLDEVCQLDSVLAEMPAWLLTSLSLRVWRRCMRCTFPACLVRLPSFPPCSSQYLQSIILWTV
ncbi:hypothetical protein Cni_G11320 [Canna indica]|uniref:Uncharacterized protein n=1 Tax=Canna indica TaxID=4628 RepID=A0AAQ3Q817_9LILI|nr:hypothetical protein Cni_G11320 [Canna indica]